MFESLSKESTVWQRKDLLFHAARAAKRHLGHEWLDVADTDDRALDCD